MLDPARTLVVITGAQAWPRLDSFEAAPAFANSAAALAGHLGKDGFGIPPENVLDLFDKPDAVAQYDRIAGFLGARAKALDAPHGAGLLVMFHYIGHGAFFGTSRDYCLLVSDTRSPMEADTSLRVASLDRLLRQTVPSSARMLFLDCCFAAEAARIMQGTVEQEVSTKSEEILTNAPLDRGVALFCAAGAKDPARLASRDSHTLCNWALLAALRTGDPDHPGPLSLRQIADVTSRVLAGLGKPDVPRPEVHVPHQAAGDLAAVRLFPNPAAPTDGTPAAEASAQLPAYRTPAVDFEKELRSALADMGPVRHFAVHGSGRPSGTVGNAASYHDVDADEILAVWQTRRGFINPAESLIFTRSGIRAKDRSRELSLNYDVFPHCAFSTGYRFEPSSAAGRVPNSHYYWLEVEHPGGTWQSRWLEYRRDIQNLTNLLKLIQRLKS
ncbi:MULTISPECIES: caspase family protein [Streptomyces]|uniref:caspase family protein n=1 Tax=Streptomyces TaxID=1883 RepID=UPI000F6C15FC|nr:caspase family protein [Streptomyces sp. W1SF4]AZM93713.1 hypothetical protein D1J60_34840 [Streptomyces sp. W1SF4]